MGALKSVSTESARMPMGQSNSETMLVRFQCVAMERLTVRNAPER